MKKILCFIISLCFIFVTSSCKNDKYKETDISVKSLYNDSSFTLNINACNVDDERDYAISFDSNLDIEDITKKYDTFESGNNYVKFYYDNNFYQLEKFDESKSNYSYLLCSEWASFLLDEDEIDGLHVPFPRNVSLSVNGITVDEMLFEYLKTYYQKIGYKIDNDSIIIPNLISLNKKKAYTVTITLNKIISVTEI